MIRTQNNARNRIRLKPLLCVRVKAISLYLTKRTHNDPAHNGRGNFKLINGEIL